MIPYNPNFLEKTDIFTEEELILLENLNTKVSLQKFLANQSYIEKFGMDFIHTSAKIEGNTYDKHDTYTLLEYGRTAGGKKYSDAKMILNMRDAYDKFIAEELTVNKDTLKDLHYILSNEMVADHERAMPRDSEVTIKASDYIPLATKEKLDDELNYMLKKYESIENPFNRALYIHCNLAYLQYFKDCNKRTARMMLNVSLKSDGQMIYIPNEEKIKEYLVAIVEYYETGNYDKFKRYFIEAYQEVAETILAVEESKKLERSKPLREG
ncbi:MAG: Fic family protein [Epsilonproteobacteria bacterium]|nr:Fic family protein [Campylobacterota bacterium]